MIGIGIDPGKATGMTMLDYSDLISPTGLAYGTHTPESVTPALDQFSHYLDDAGGFIVIEKFVTREGKHGVDTTALRVIGRVEEWLRDKPYQVYWQLPVEKELASNDVLRRLGLWLKGTEQRHIMDATRHVVVRLTKMGHKPTMQKGWPR